jgi:hypothetical protein
MNHNKKIIISLGIVFSVVLLSISILKISINILYPGNELSDSLKDSFKDIFGKAIKFDSLYFKYNGDIILQNFYLSNTNDFNDNINLIKCREITIDTNLFDLVRKKVTFAGVYMIEPEVVIIKNFGKTYHETFIDDLIGNTDKDSIRKFVKDGFIFELIDSNLTFRETFRNSKSEINITDFDFKIKYKNNSISYRSYGIIHDKIRDSWFKSSYKASGKIFLDRNYSESDIELKNFDLTHLNNLLNDQFTTRTLVTGNFSGDLNFISDNEIIKCKGSTETSALNLFYYENDTPYPFFRNEDIITDFNFNISKKFDKLTIDNLKIDDGTFKITVSFDYLKDDFVSIKLDSNKIDLDELSDSIYFFKNCSYNGYISFNGICRFSLKDNKPENLNFNFKMNNFNILPDNKNTRSLTDIKDGNISLTADNNKIALKTDFKSGKSDFIVSYNGLISNWSPVKSENSIEISSKKLELDLLRELFTGAIKKVYNLAYVDMFQNFDQQMNFLKEPEGIFINNNDISLKLYAEKLVVAGNSHLNNLNLNLSLIKGIVKTNNFTLDGYNGIYTFNLYSSLRQEYPFFKFDASAKDLDLTGISNNSGINYFFGGKFSLDMNFETSAYRIGQVVENGKASLDIEITDGYIDNTPIQLKLNDFMVRNNYNNVFNSIIYFPRFTISFSQSANNFYIRNFNLNGTYISFNCYGTYTEDDGLKIPVSLNITKENTTDRVPLEIYGSLAAPCLKVKSKEKTETTCF